MTLTQTVDVDQMEPQLTTLIDRLSALLEAPVPPAWLTLPGIRNTVETARDRAAVAWLRLQLHQQQGA